jgi:sulfoxide reductase heme-binding subunit YedZ
LFLLILSGVGLMTGGMFRFLEPLRAWINHRALGLALLVSVLVHITALLFDTYQPFSLADVLVPFHSTYKRISLFGVNVGSLHVSLGILAFYFLLIVTLTSIFWINKRPRAWKLVHFSTYAIAILVFFHALDLGTDLKKTWVKDIWFLGGSVLLIAILARQRRSSTSSDVVK